MKKSRLLILGVVITLLLVGGAYAAWTAQTDITVNASSGELNMIITGKSVEDISPDVEFTSSNISISEDKMSASVAVGNMYPGSSVEFNTYMTNTGTIPVKLDKITHAAIEVIDKETNKSLGLDANVFADFQAAYTIYALDENGNTIGTLSGYTTEKQTNWVEDVYTNNDLPSIPAGGSIDVEMKVYLEEEATEITQNKLFRFTITPNFIQGS